MCSLAIAQAKDSANNEHIQSEFKRIPREGNDIVRRPRYSKNVSDVVDKSIGDSGIPFQTIDWSKIPKVQYETVGRKEVLQTVKFHGLSISIAEYSKGYDAEQLCQKGHIVYCLEGEFIIKMYGGEKYVMRKGMSYVVSDEKTKYRLYTDKMVKLMLIEGDLF